MINMIQGDCMDYMATMKDNEYDLAIVDPPYGIFSEKKRTGFTRKMKVSEAANEWDKRPAPEYFQELFRVSKHQIIWGLQYFLDDLPDATSILVWDKKTGKSYFADGEAAFCSLPGTLRIFSHQWAGSFKDSEREAKNIAACQKPVALYKWLLTKYAKPGWRILDTHGGSGSICLAAHDLGFDLTWIEKMPEIYEAAVARYQDHASQMDLFPPDMAQPTGEQLDLIT